MAIINPDIRITAAARFDTEAAVGNKILKQTLQQQSGTDARRLSRLSLIAALGAGLLRGQGEIRPDCAVFLGTPFSSPSVFEKMADNVLNHHAAMPFDFIANLHNAPVFHAAQTLGTHGATLAVATERHLETRFHPPAARRTILAKRRTGGSRLGIRTPSHPRRYARRQHLDFARTRHEIRHSRYLRYGSRRYGNRESGDAVPSGGCTI